MVVAYCTICKEVKDIVEQITPKKRYLKLSCGHIYDWNTGICSEETEAAE